MKIEVTTKTSKLDRLKLKALKELQRFISRILALGKQDPVQDADQAQETQNTPPTSEAIAGSEEPSQVNEQQNLKLHSFGSPNVANARFNPDAQITGFKMDKKGMSYKWVKGGCEQLGAKDKQDAGMTLAVCGYSTNGIDFHVTKFDWISTSRTTRSWENVYEHYNGINPDMFFNAPKRCFFICDKHGSYRTNILTD